MIEPQVFTYLWNIYLRTPENLVGSDKSEEEKASILHELKSENRAAIQLLTMGATVEPLILSKQKDFLIKQSIRRAKISDPDWLMLKDSLKAFRKIATSEDSAFLKSIICILLQNASTSDGTWLCVAEELINTIFLLQENPEELSEYFIKELSKPLISSDEDEEMKEKTTNDANPFPNENCSPFGKDPESSQNSCFETKITSKECFKRLKF
jgi:hypothetical protein